MFPLKKKKNILKITKFLDLHPFLFVYMHNNLSTKEWNNLKKDLIEKTTYNVEQKQSLVHSSDYKPCGWANGQTPQSEALWALPKPNQPTTQHPSENKGSGGLLLVKNKGILKVIQKEIQERGENRTCSLNKNKGLLFKGNPKNNQLSFLFTGPILLFGIRNRNSRESIQPTFRDRIKLLKTQDKENYKNCKNVHDEIVKSAEVFKNFPSLFFLGGFYGSEDINHLEYLFLAKRKVPEVESLLISSLKNPRVLHLLNHKAFNLLRVLKYSSIEKPV